MNRATLFHVRVVLLLRQIDEEEKEALKRRPPCLNRKLGPVGSGRTAEAMLNHVTRELRKPTLPTCAIVLRNLSKTDCGHLEVFE